MTVELTGHAAVGHLWFDETVQGQEIVLEGVESGETSTMAGAVELAVDAANAAGADTERLDQRDDLPAAEADAIAQRLRASRRRAVSDTATSSNDSEGRCRRWAVAPADNAKNADRTERWRACRE